jgi:hypothetical protein
LLRNLSMSFAYKFVWMIATFINTVT